MRIIRFADLPETPWKNGGGITRTLASDTDVEGVLWRLSIADVDVDGPFSSFAGLTRILTVIRGGGMILRSPDAVMTADYAMPVMFDGATPITAHLGQGPLRDLNLMYDTARCTGAVNALHGPVEVALGSPDRIIFIHCIAGRALIGRDQVLDVGDTAMARSPLHLSLEKGDSALSITVDTHSQTDASKSATADL